ncbi:uncharacterized protein LOC113305037 [Papaver somniferum]|uniref:uncharacterized protein LOC113305037 n=1 Tax=Papaver somniferum TaxID=3469 RepID=UPI000E702433|nr:uncharacterized protein LOC113305037 [Papaver somniferum]
MRLSESVSIITLCHCLSIVVLVAITVANVSAVSAVVKPRGCARAIMYVSESLLKREFGARNDAGYAGIGGVLRGADGCFRAAFAHYIHKNSNNVAELWAIRDEMQLEASIGVTNLIVESDSDYAISLCKHQHNATWYCTGLLRDILDLSLSFDHVSFQHHYKEGTYAADSLSKKAANECISCVWVDSPPGFLGNVLSSDVMGRAFPGL